MTPYLNACGPPAFVATLPPICDCSAAPGSGGKAGRSRARAGARLRAQPGLDLDAPEQRIERAHAVSRSSERTTPPSSGTAPRRTRPAAARHDRDPVRVAPGDHLGDLRYAAARQHPRDRSGPAPRSCPSGRRRSVRRVRGDRSAQVTLDGCDGGHLKRARGRRRPSRSTGSPCETSTISTGRSSSGCRPARKALCV